MGLPDDSWHIRYFEYSYMYYISFAFVIVMIYSVFYCIRASATPFGTLRDIVGKILYILFGLPNQNITEKLTFMGLMIYFFDGRCFNGKFPRRNCSVKTLVH